MTDERWNDNGTVGDQLFNKPPTNHQQTTNKNCIVTLCKYAYYNLDCNSKPPTNHQQTTNRWPKSDQQTTNKQPSLTICKCVGYNIFSDDVWPKSDQQMTNRDDLHEEKEGERERNVSPKPLSYKEKD